jgi:hypothetical protein
MRSFRRGHASTLRLSRSSGNPRCPSGRLAAPEPQSDAFMSVLRKQLSQRLRRLGIEERAWPGRDDGFASLLFRGKEFAHFHSHDELDIRLGRDVIKREKLVHLLDSTVHPDRSVQSAWYEMRFRSAADVDEALRLVRLAVGAIAKKA